MISVIVPIYNVESYLEECLESIVGQTYAKLEIILVDDGSTDSSGDICEEWKSKDNRIQVIHQANGGLSRARNAGLAVAKGEYIAFVDSDDFVHPQMYERMLEVLKKTQADMALCREYAFEDGESVDLALLHEEATFEIEDREQHLLHFCEKFSGVVTWAWNKLYRRTLLQGLLFEPDTIQEDILFSATVASGVNRVVRVDERLYFYRQRKESLMNCVNPERFMQCAEVAEKEFYLLREAMEDKLHVKLYHTILERVADYAASSFWKKESHLTDIEVIFRRLFDEIDLQKKFKFYIVRYFPRMYYVIKGVRK